MRSLDPRLAISSGGHLRMQKHRGAADSRTSMEVHTKASTSSRIIAL